MLAFTIITGIASILGLGFSIAAWLEAREAASEAKQARKAVRRSSAAEMLTELNHNASELLAFIQSDQFQAASVRARDLFGQIRSARRRWERFFTAEAGANLDNAQSKVKEISNSLMRKGLVVPPRAKWRLMEYGHLVIGILSDESSKIVATIEAEEE
jgi:hypothetical protein